jgi:hypothetical protein
LVSEAEKTVIVVVLTFLKVVWASPNTLLAGTVGLVNMAAGGRVQIRRGCIEFYGGPVRFILRRLPNGPISAMTFGHVIIGTSQRDLHDARDHEHVHVAQYERWGPFFLPAYLACSAYLLMRGCDAYRDNPFEVEAYSKAP